MSTPLGLLQRLRLRYGLRLNPSGQGGVFSYNPAPVLEDLLDGYEVVWSDNFESLSLRTGFKYTDNSSGLFTGLGTWASAGQTYMNQDKGFPGFGRDYWIRNDFNWQSIDPSFPPLGMIDIGINGLELHGSEDYPLIRAAIPVDTSGFPRFLSSLVMSGYSAKIATPYARRIRWTLDSNGDGRYDFPAVWGLGQRYAGFPAIPHQEVDEFERFGVDNPITTVHQGVITPSGRGSGLLNLGYPIVDRVMETVVVQTDTIAYLFCDGVYNCQIALGAGFVVDDLHHVELDMATGMTFHDYPGSFTASISGTTMSVTNLPHLGLPIAIGQTIVGAAANTVVMDFISGTGDVGDYLVSPSQTLASTILRRGPPVVGNPKITIHSVEILAPPSNTTGVFPPDPPVPVLTWGVDFPNGNVSGDVTVGAVLGTLSGASTYSVLDYNGAAPSHLAVSGSNLITTSFLAAGSYKFYIRGVDAGGIPGIPPPYTMTVNGDPHPTLTSVFVYQIGPVVATVSVGTNIADGTVYWIVDTSATPPSAAQIKAGQNSSGVAAIASGNQAVIAPNTQFAYANGLTASTGYYAYFLHRNALGNDSSVATSPLFTTTAAGTAWDPVAYFGSHLKCWFDTVDTSTLTISGGTVTSWAAKVGGQTATPSVAPAYSATARNGLPGVIFSGAERMTFSATGLPTGDGALAMVGYQSSTDGVFRIAGGYGGASGAHGTGRLISTSSNLISTYMFAISAGPSTYSWSLNDRIAVTNFNASTGVVTGSIDGNFDPATQNQLPITPTLTRGVIGTSSDLATNKQFHGTIQCLMIIDRVLTQLENDKLSGFLAWRYNLVSQLPVSHPYKFFAPTNESTLTSDPMASFSVVWEDDFQSLSIRTGNYYSGTTTGYNSPTAKGTWAVCPQSYMTSPTGVTGYGKDYFINSNYNWQAIDPTFPPLGMIDITAGGLYMFGSQDYPAIRATLPGASYTPLFLSPQIGTTQSMKIGFPFARKWLFTLSSTGSYDFPALWSLGEHYNGNPAHPKHQEWDDFERYGVEYSDLNTNQGELLLTVTGGSHNVRFNTGVTIAGGGQTELTCVVFADRTLFYTNGVLTLIAPHSPPGFDVYDLAHALLNFSVGMSFESWPGTCNVSIAGTAATIGPPTGGHIDLAVGQLITGAGIAPGTIITNIGTAVRGFGGVVTVNNSQTVSTVKNAVVTPVLTQVPNMTVRSIQMLAPPTNISGLFPAAAPVPAITWGGSYAAGHVPVGTPGGTVVATLSGASTYTLMDYNGAAPSNLAVSGSNVVVSGSLLVGIFNFYIRGVDGGGVPGIAPKLTLTVG